MQESYIVAAIGAVVVLTLIALFIVVANTQKTIIVKVQENGVEEEEKPHITIEALSEIAAKRKTSKNELTKAVLEASKYCPFPQKIKGVAPKSSKIYLNFATSSSRTGGSTDGRLGEQMETWVEDFTGATTRPKKRSH